MNLMAKESGINSCQGITDFYLIQSIQNGTGVQSVYYSSGTGGLFAWWYSGQGAKVTTHHQMTGLRISRSDGSQCTRKTLPFTPITKFVWAGLHITVKIPTSFFPRISVILYSFYVTGTTKVYETTHIKMFIQSLVC